MVLSIYSFVFSYKEYYIVHLFYLKDRETKRKQETEIELPPPKKCISKIKPAIYIKYIVQWDSEGHLLTVAANGAIVYLSNTNSL